MSAKHRRKLRGRWQHVYDGHDLVGVIEQQTDGRWAVIKLGVIVSRHPTREQALSALDHQQIEEARR